MAHPPAEPQSWLAGLVDDAGVEDLRRQLEAVKAALEAHDTRIFAADLARLGEGERSGPA
ncbi:hypothetical protein [Phenylobacterium sp. LjRoot225]|uniref:hypothetical protein n=1 Tax=Phenylobacterium sp. LjRoot225 TaxID=3342285 RepID=UPI003F4F6CD3